ncbi:MAG: copper homeostasis protein CutC [Muribaculaceae bacterium]
MEVAKCELEICCASAADVTAARVGGADRVELCMALTAEGVTPSAGLIAATLSQAGDMAVTVLIRAREGDFVYDEADVAAMVSDIEYARRCGAAGVTVGALTASGTIDMEAMRRFMSAAGNMEVTFHRAFDVCADRGEALEQLVALGCKRVLTSGDAPTASAGVNTLARLVAQADGRIQVMPGGGVRPANIGWLRAATGACAFHSSARGAASSCGDADSMFAGRPAGVDASIVAAMRRALG